MNGAVRRIPKAFTHDLPDSTALAFRQPGGTPIATRSERSRRLTPTNPSFLKHLEPTYVASVRLVPALRLMIDRE